MNSPLTMTPNKPPVGRQEDQFAQEYNQKRKAAVLLGAVVIPVTELGARVFREICPGTQGIFCRKVEQRHCGGKPGCVTS